ncbi:hypothetical protein LguiA_028744 [Lonicera macranthoides]
MENPSFPPPPGINIPLPLCFSLPIPLLSINNTHIVRVYGSDSNSQCFSISKELLFLQTYGRHSIAFLLPWR